MMSLRPEGWTRAMGQDQEEYRTLHIRDEVDPNFGPVMVSMWEPTPAERDAIARGGSVVLAILGTGWPPVVLYAREPGE